MILIANRQLSGSYGLVRPGDSINVTDPQDILVLIEAGVVRVPSVTYETKVIVAAPVVAAPPFRDLRDAVNFQPAAFLEQSNPIVSEPVVEPERTLDRPRRRGRPPGSRNKHKGHRLP